MTMVRIMIVIILMKKMTANLHNDHILTMVTITMVIISMIMITANRLTI